MKKKKKKSKGTPQWIYVVLTVISSFFLGVVVRGAIRMTDDKKPKRESYQVKDVITGCVSVKYVYEDQDFPYKVGDFFVEADNNTYPNGDPRFSIVHKYVIIAKK